MHFLFLLAYFSTYRMSGTSFTETFFKGDEGLLPGIFFGEFGCFNIEPFIPLRPFIGDFRESFTETLKCDSMVIRGGWPKELAPFSRNFSRFSLFAAILSEFFSFVCELLRFSFRVSLLVSCTSAPSTMFFAGVSPFLEIRFISRECIKNFNVLRVF